MANAVVRCYAIATLDRMGGVPRQSSEAEFRGQPLSGPCCLLCLPLPASALSPQPALLLQRHCKRSHALHSTGTQATCTIWVLTDAWPEGWVPCARGLGAACLGAAMGKTRGKQGQVSGPIEPPAKAPPLATPQRVLTKGTDLHRPSLHAAHLCALVHTGTAAENPTCWTQKNRTLPATPRTLPTTIPRHLAQHFAPFFVSRLWHSATCFRPCVPRYRT